jgi:hypothetical protein
MNPHTTFQPLYTRHVSGCIIVANTSNPKSLERAHKWKEMFDLKTKVPNEPPIPATIFINHDACVKDSRRMNKLELPSDGNPTSPAFASERERNSINFGSAEYRMEKDKSEG